MFNEIGVGRFSTLKEILNAIGAVANGIEQRKRIPALISIESLDKTPVIVAVWIFIAVPQVIHSDNVKAVDSCVEVKCLLLFIVRETNEHLVLFVSVATEKDQIKVCGRFPVSNHDGIGDSDFFELVLHAVKFEPLAPEILR